MTRSNRPYAICLEPVGVVEEGLPPGEKSTSRFTVVGRIRFYEPYTRALDGLEEYSHAWILTWLDRAERRLVARPRGAPSPLGAYATRSPSRPNPIGLTLVEILEVDPPILIVRGLDAYPGTPVLDVKPYDYMDVVCEPRVPSWVEAEWRRRRSVYEKLAPWLGPCHG